MKSRRWFKLVIFVSILFSLKQRTKNAIKNSDRATTETKLIDRAKEMMAKCMRTKKATLTRNEIKNANGYLNKKICLIA